MITSPISLYQIIEMLRLAGIKERHVNTAGDLADALESAYRLKHYRLAPPPQDQAAPIISSNQQGKP